MFGIMKEIQQGLKKLTEMESEIMQIEHDWNTATETYIKLLPESLKEITHSIKQTEVLLIEEEGKPTALIGWKIPLSEKPKEKNQIIKMIKEGYQPYLFSKLIHPVAILCCALKLTFSLSSFSFAKKLTKFAEETLQQINKLHPETKQVKEE